MTMPPPPPIDWQQVRQLFDTLAALPPGERAAALAASQASDAVRREVASLLDHAAAAETGPDGFLARSAAGDLAHGDDHGSATADADAPVDRSGQRLGPWRITGLLGRGGMGEVWAARRDDGAWDGAAAVKVLRHGLDSQRVLGRFAQEQRSLARLNHPHIAHLLDAGRTADGLPYFVMEAVDGQPIDRACAGRSVEQRLALFLQLADAVAHAHRQLLVHRDLKPGNVLVNADGQVKLLDFGIAKALDPMEGSDGSTTIAGERPFTPQFASPEQVRGEPVGTATDLYSLGVLLYVMLTGLRPYGREATSALEAARSVLHDEPTRPSELSPGLGADPRWLATRKRLVGDLDNILLKALDKRVDHRYASVDAFAADIRAHLAGYPVSARAPRAGYLLAKFTQRNKALVAASALAVLALLGGLGATAWQAREAALARDAARGRLAETRQIVRDIVTRYADAITFLPGGLKLRADLLTDTVRHLDRLVVDAPGDPALAGDLAVTYARLADLQADNMNATLADPKAAARYTSQALALFPLGEPAHARDELFLLWWARAMRAQANVQRSAGDAAGALQWRERQRDLLLAARQRGIDSRDARSELGSALVGIGQLYDTVQVASLHRPAEAMKAFEQADAVYRQLAAEHPKEATYPYQLGTLAGARMLVLVKQGRFEEAAPLGREAVAQRRVSLALEPDNVAMPDGLALESSNLATVLLDLNLDDEALQRTTEARQLLLALERADPTMPTWPKRRQALALHHGRALLAAGRPAEAVPVLREALLPMANATQGLGLRRRAWGHLALAEALAGQGTAAEARREIDTAQRLLQDFLAKAPGDAEGVLLLARAEAVAAGLQTDAPAQAVLRQQALQRLDEAASRQPLRPSAQRLRAQLLAAPG